MAVEKGRNPKPSRYVTPNSPEVEFEPGSRMRVLKSRLGIRRKTEMDRVEFEALLVSARFKETYVPAVRIGLHEKSSGH